MRNIETSGKEYTTFSMQEDEEAYEKEEHDEEMLSQLFGNIAGIYVRNLGESLKNNAKFSEEEVSEKIKDYLATLQLSDTKRLANYYLTGVAICSAYCEEIRKNAPESFGIHTEDELEKLDILDMQERARDLTEGIAEEIEQKFKELDNAKPILKQDKLALDLIKEYEAEGQDLKEALKNYGMDESLAEMAESKQSSHAYRILLSNSAVQSQERGR